MWGATSNVAKVLDAEPCNHFHNYIIKEKLRVKRRVNRRRFSSPLFFR